jgi:hypothetical protein
MLLSQYCLRESVSIIVRASTFSVISLCLFLSISCTIQKHMCIKYCFNISSLIQCEVSYKVGTVSQPKSSQIDLLLDHHLSTSPNCFSLHITTHEHLHQANQFITPLISLPFTHCKGLKLLPVSLSLFPPFPLLLLLL